MERQTSISHPGPCPGIADPARIRRCTHRNPSRTNDVRSAHDLAAPDAARATTTVRLVIMKRLSAYLVVFPLVTVMFLIALGLTRSGTSHLLFVSAAAFALMLLPAVVVWAVDVLAGRTLWCAIAGFVAVPLAIDVALYSVASPRILESIYFGIAGAVAAAVCRAIAAAVARKSSPMQ